MHDPKVPHFRKPQDVSVHMVVPWIGYIIWKNWVIHVLVFLVFHVFSTAELISIAKTVNLAVWAFSSNFLHDFTLFAIDMNYIYHISSIATTFGPLSKVTILGQKCMTILGIRHIVLESAKQDSQLSWPDFLFVLNNFLFSSHIFFFPVIFSFYLGQISFPAYHLFYYAICHFPSTATRLSDKC